MTKKQRKINSEGIEAKSVKVVILSATLFISLLYFLTFISALSDDAGTSIDFTYATSTNYSLINTNNSVYWNGYPWSDTRWRTFDNHTINGQLEVNNSGTSIFTDTLDLTGIGAGVIPRLNGHGSLYDIIMLRNGVMVDWDDSFPYLLLLFNDDNDDGTPEDEPAFTFNAGTDTLFWNDLLGGDVHFATDGNLYEQTDDRVCTGENGICNGTDYNSTGLIQDYNGTGLIQDWNSTGYIQNWNSSGYIQNWSAIITSSGDSLWTNESNVITSINHNSINVSKVYTNEIQNQQATSGIIYNNTLGAWGIE